MTETATVPSTGKFQIAGKHIFRASIVALQMGTRADGSPNIVQQPGPMERLEVGTELTDVTDAELKAFGDRLAPMDDTAQQSLRKARGLDDATLAAAAEASGVPPSEVPLPPVGAPSSPADTPKPLQPVQEAPEVVSAKAEATRRQASTSSAAAPAAPAPTATHTTPATDAGSRVGRRGD